MGDKKEPKDFVNDTIAKQYAKDQNSFIVKDNIIEWLKQNESEGSDDDKAFKATQHYLFQTNSLKNDSKAKNP